LLALVTLVINAVAGPVQRPGGISIPLHKRGGLTTTDGVFDLSKAIRTSVITQNKVRQNLMSIKANGGTLREGAYIRELAFIPSKVNKRQNEALIDEDNDIAWAGEVSIGTPPKKFLIDFDSMWPPRFYLLVSYLPILL
jgi:cathepsin D